MGLQAPYPTREEVTQRRPTLARWDWAAIPSPVAEDRDTLSQKTGRGRKRRHLPRLEDSAPPPEARRGIEEKSGGGSKRVRRGFSNNFGGTGGRMGRVCGWCGLGGSCGWKR
jgi:hypothetical protein